MVHPAFQTIIDNHLNIARAQRSFDNQQSTDYYDTRTDEQIEQGAADRVKEALAKKRAALIDEKVKRDEPMWAALEEKRLAGKK